MTEIAKRLDFFCKSKGMNYKNLAEVLGVTPPAIYSIMNGNTKKPGADILIGLEKLGINTSWLLTGQGEMLLEEPNKAKTNFVEMDFLLKELQQKDSIIRTLQGIIDSQLMNLGKLFDVLCSRFVFFVFIKDKFRYIKVM